MSKVKLKKDVQVVKEDAFISKVYIRPGSYGVGGMVFEFSNGDRVAFIDPTGGTNTNPMAILEGENCGYGPVGGGVTAYGIESCNKMKKDGVVIIDLPDGFDMMKIGYTGEPHKYGYALKQMYFYKNKVLLGQFADSGWCCNTTTELTLPEGQIANGFFIKHYEYSDYYPYIFPKELYGMSDPNAKPIDGGWSAWDKWGSCSKACGPGNKKRVRTCSEPYPVLGGKACEGDPFEINTCNLKDCAVNGAWGDWGDWNKCNAECDQVGFQRRNRACDNPKPMGGGTGCTGETYEIKDCNGAACNKPIDGAWSGYGSWTDCLKNSDGKLEQKRARECNNPAPKFGGKVCGGAAFQLKNCVNEPEPVIDDTDGALTVSSDSSTVTQPAKVVEAPTAVTVSVSTATTSQESWTLYYILAFIAILLLGAWGLSGESNTNKVGGFSGGDPFEGSGYVSYT